jgi:hypothetical protein
VPTRDAYEMLLPICHDAQCYVPVGCDVTTVFVARELGTFADKYLLGESDDLIEHKNIIHFIKAQSLRGLGHVERMPEEGDVKKIYKWKLIASRPIGHPKIRWVDNVMKDIQAMKIVNWKRCAHDRNKWKSIFEQAKTRIFVVPSMNEWDCLCGLVVRVPGYISRGPGSIPGATRFSEK